MDNFELEFLDRILPTLSRNENIVVGVGDDCAAIKVDKNSDKLLLLASDQIIGNVHYFENNTKAYQVGAKLLKRNLSDIAAMGGKPLYVLVNIANGGVTLDYLAEFMRGISEVGNEYGVFVIGGDTGSFKSSLESNDSHLVASLTIVGEVQEKFCAMRNLAKAGDYIFITGNLGKSLENGHHLDFIPRLQEGEFLTKNGFSRCMMDISDGLFLDLERILKSSKLSAKIDLSKIPLRDKNYGIEQISSGEDYELLFAVSPLKVAELLKVWDNKFAKITQIGEFIDDKNYKILDMNNNKINIRDKGYEH